MTVVAPNGNVVPDAGVQVGVSVPAMVSVADAENVTAAPAALVASCRMLAGTVTTGGVVSATITLNVPVAVFPAMSWALQFTGVVPSGNVAPEAGLQDTATAPSESSSADAVYVTIAP